MEGRKGNGGREGSEDEGEEKGGKVSILSIQRS